MEIENKKKDANKEFVSKKIVFIYSWSLFAVAGCVPVYEKFMAHNSYFERDRLVLDDC